VPQPVRTIALLVFFALVCPGWAALDTQRIPPLTTTQAARLELARAAVGQRGDAFAALVEHLGAWPAPETIEIDAEPLRRQVDWAAVVQDPAVLRGELVLVTGTIAMRSTIELSYSQLAIEEWFIQVAQETLVAFVAVSQDASWSQGQRVTVLGRLYTTISERSRDGVERTWPALVGVPLRSQPAAGGSGPWILGGVVVFALGVFVLIRRAVKGPGRTSTDQALAALARDADVEDEKTVEASLPDDPAEALGVLRHAQAPEQDHDA